MPGAKPVKKLAHDLLWPKFICISKGVRQRLSRLSPSKACLKSTSILYLNKILNYLPQFADNCRISFCARHGGTRLQSQHLGTRCRAEIQSRPRLHEILSRKRVLLLTCSKWGKYVCPFPPSMLMNWKKILIQFHSIIYSTLVKGQTTDIAPRSQQPAACWAGDTARE